MEMNWEKEIVMQIHFYTHILNCKEFQLTFNKFKNKLWLRIWKCEINNIRKIVLEQKKKDTCSKWGSSS